MNSATYHGWKCKACGGTEKYATTKRCVACANKSEYGQTYEGNACKRCRGTTRYSKSGKCTSCSTATNKTAYRASNVDMNNAWPPFVKRPMATPDFSKDNLIGRLQ